MRTIVNAVLSYGLVSVPVGVATAAKRKELSFRTLHRDCQTPVSQIKWCKVCDCEATETVKGFEFAKNQFVVIEDEDLEAVAPDRSKVVQLSMFAEEREIDPIWFDRTYYLAPNATLAMPYVLLWTAMAKERLFGIGKSILWGKEYPCAVHALEGGILGLSMLFCEDEIMPTDKAHEILGKVEIGDTELGMASELLRMYTRPFTPDVLISESRMRIEQMVADKMAGVEVRPAEPQPEPAPTMDVQEQLRKSIELARATGVS